MCKSMWPGVPAGGMENDWPTGNHCCTRVWPPPIVTITSISGYPRLFSQKGSPTMADADRLGKIASIGQDLITTQLTMAMQTPSQALEGTWVLGYCFGI